jgi:hypothetical protein
MRYSIDELNEMSDREIAALGWTLILANRWNESKCRVCGWSVGGNWHENRSVLHNGPCTTESSMQPPPKKRADEPPKLDHNFAVTLEKKVQDVSPRAKGQYMAAIGQLAKASYLSDPVEMFWRMHTASPRARVIAAVMTMQKEGE